MTQTYARLEEAMAKKTEKVVQVCMQLVKFRHICLQNVSSIFLYTVAIYVFIFNI